MLEEWGRAPNLKGNRSRGLDIGHRPARKDAIGLLADYALELLCLSTHPVLGKSLP